MLEVVAGPFHPALESALVQDVRARVFPQTVSPLVLVVPSEQLRFRLKWLLCREHGLSLFQVHVLTFSQLAIRILEHQSEPLLPRLYSDTFFKEMIHHYLILEFGDAPDWDRMVALPGAWAALWETVQHLKNAGVEEQVVLEAEEPSDPLFENRLGWLMRLYTFLRQGKEQLGAWDHEDVIGRARTSVEESSFPDNRARVIFYGFYDFNQLQLDLFQAVIRRWSSSMYIPYVPGHPAFAFAKRFVERHIWGLAGESIRFVDFGHHHPLQDLFGEFSLPSLSRNAQNEARAQSGQIPHTPMERGGKAGCSSGQPIVSVSQVSGIDDEITIVAKDILGWAEERQVPFQDIGVVGRSLAGYETVIPHIFAQHQIPLTTSMTRPLRSFPIAQVVLQFLELGHHDFRRDQVMEVLTSPFIRLSKLCPDLAHPRPVMWDLLSRHLGIRKGAGDWRRLQAVACQPYSLQNGEELMTSVEWIEQAEGLWQAVMILQRTLGDFPQRGSWSQFVTHTESILRRYLNGDAQGGNGGEPNVECIVEVLEEAHALAPLGGRLLFSEFTASVRRWLEERPVPLLHAVPDGAGVRVMDAMEARGLPFRILYVIGMTEKVFPRQIQEDPFLRDRVRRQLDLTLGFKIPEKLNGYDEEKLLFYLLANSASESVTFLWQRSDADGRPLVPSSYVSEVHRCVGPLEERIVPKRLVDKIGRSSSETLQRCTPRDYERLYLLGQGIPPQAVRDRLPVWNLVRRGLPVLQEYENRGRSLGAFDGLIGFEEERWAACKERGVTATSLENYAKCPFLYFADSVLGLRPLPVPENVMAVTSREIGILAHAILREAWQLWLVDRQASVDDVYSQVAGPILEKFRLTNSVGYELIWELRQEKLSAILRQVLIADREEMERGWGPVLFEQRFSGSLELPLSAGMESVPLQGHMDRVDWSAARRAYRVVDYKYTEAATPRAFEKHLNTAVIRGQHLQPPLYLLLAQQGVPDILQRLKLSDVSPETPSCDGVVLLVIAPKRFSAEEPVSRVVFPGDAWQGQLRTPMEHTLTVLVKGIRDGQFFMVPASHCEWCEYRTLCHRTHEPSLQRVRTDKATVGPHRRLQRASLPKHQASSHA